MVEKPCMIDLSVKMRSTRVPTPERVWMHTPTLLGTSSGVVSVVRADAEADVPPVGP